MVNPKVQEMLDLAVVDVERLRKAASSQDAQMAWTNFLEHSNRAINRLEGHARKTGQLPRYNAMIKKEIWEGDLTKYVRLARHAHEHGVSDTQIDAPYDERLVLPNGLMTGMRTVIGITEAGEEVPMSAAGPMEFEGSPGIRKVTLKPGIMLVSIKDRSGTVVRPPGIPNFEAEDESHAAAVARSFLDWVFGKMATFA